MTDIDPTPGLCWCRRPIHPDLIDGCVGDPFLRAMFGPPTVESMILTAVTMYGDLVALAVNGDEEALAVIRANPLPKPDIETDKAMLRLAGMDVSDADIQSLRDWYWPNREEWPL